MTIHRTFLSTSALVGMVLGAVVLDVTLAHAQQPTAVAPLVFDGVTVIDVQYGKSLPAQRVVIVGNRIKRMGDMGKVPVPSGARVVNARGKYLIPGLWDMHTHSRLSTDVFYPLFIANGVTGIRDAWSEVSLDTLRRWRREILAGARVGPPRQILSGPALDEAQPCARGEGQGHICVADSADARHVVDSLKTAGADFIKTYRLGRDLYFVVAAEARRIGIPFGGHLTAATAIEASDSGASILDHEILAGGLDTFCLADSAYTRQYRPHATAGSTERCRPVVERFQRNGTWWVPTFVRAWVQGQTFPRPATQTVLTRFSQFSSAFWAGVPFHPGWLGDSARGKQPTRTTLRDSTADSGGLLHIMQRVGLPILAGTDVGAPVMREQPPGFSLHLELAMYVAEGLTPLAALQAATLNPAKLLHGTDSLGTVAPGKLADLVLLDANPLTDITNITLIRAVVANGRYFDRAALDQLLADVQAKAK